MNLKNEKTSKDKRGQYLIKRKWYLLNKDKVKKNNKKFIQLNPEKVKLYKIKYVLNNSNKVKESKKKWNEKNIKKLREISRNYKHKNPQRVFAINSARKIPRKDSCEICGSKDKLEKHHWRYDKPLLVNTLCYACHKIQHLKNKNE